MYGALQLPHPPLYFFTSFPLSFSSVFSVCCLLILLLLPLAVSHASWQTNFMQAGGRQKSSSSICANTHRRIYKCIYISIYICIYVCMCLFAIDETGRLRLLPQTLLVVVASFLCERARVFSKNFLSAAVPQLPLPLQNFMAAQQRGTDGAEEARGDSGAGRGECKRELALAGRPSQQRRICLSGCPLRRVLQQQQQHYQGEQEQE